MACNRNAHRERLEQTVFQKLQDMNIVSEHTRQDMRGNIYVDYAFNAYTIEGLQEQVDIVNNHFSSKVVAIYKNNTIKSKYLKIKIPASLVDASIKNEDTIPDVPTDPNGQYRLFSPDSIVEKESDKYGQESSLESFTRFKDDLIDKIRDRLNNVTRSIDKLKDDLKNKLIGQDEYNERSKELKELNVNLKARMSGSTELKIQGLYDDAKKIRSKTYIIEVRDAMMNDIKRAKELSKSTDSNDILEAIHILQYYSKINDLTRKGVNPLLTDIDVQDVIHDKDIAEELEEQGGMTEQQKKENLYTVLNEVAIAAAGVMHYVSEAEVNIIVSIFNNNRFIREMFPERFQEGNERPFDVDEVFEKLEGMDDAKWYDALVNLTSSISGNITLYEQVMFAESMATKIQEEYLSRQVQEAVTGILTKLKSELKKLKKGYEIFIDKTTGELGRRFTGSYYTEFRKARSIFESEVKEATEQGLVSKINSELVKAHKKFLKWVGENNFIIDNDSFPEISDGAPTYKSQKLRKDYGEKAYNDAIEQQKKLNILYQEALDEKETELVMKYNVSSVDDFNEMAIYELEYWKRTHSVDYFMKVYINPNLMSVSNKTLIDRARAGLILQMPLTDEDTGLPLLDSQGRVRTRSVEVRPVSDYSYMVPRIKKFDSKTGKESDVETQYYSENFKIIENNPTLLEFYNIMSEALRRIYNILPYGMTKNLDPSNLWLLNDSMIEMLKKAEKDKMFGLALILLWTKAITYINKNFGKKMTVSTPETGSYYNRKKLSVRMFVSNTKEVKQRFNIEFSKLLDHFEETVTEFTDQETKEVRKTKKINKASRNFRILRSKISSEGISILMSMMTETGGDIRLLEKNVISVGEILHAYSTMKVIDKKSFNLPSMIIALSHHASALAGAAKIEASQILLQEGSKMITAPARDTEGNIVKDVGRGYRRRTADKIQAAMDLQVWDEHEKSINTSKWFMKLPIVSREEKKLAKEFDESIDRARREGTGLRLDEINEALDKYDFTDKIISGLGIVKNSLEKGNKRMALTEMKIILRWVEKEYGKEDDRYNTIEDIRNSIRLIGNYILVNDLQKEKEEMTTYLTSGSIGEIPLTFWRFAGLAVNVGAMYTNVLAGIIVNTTMSQLQTRFTPDSYYRALHVTGQSPIKYLTWGKVNPNGARKTSILMNRYRILQDITNELQKAESMTAFKGMVWRNPYVLVVRGEYMVQSPIMVAMMMDYQIKGVDSEGNVITSSAWNALNKHGKLKSGFDTPHNIQTWEQSATEEASEFISSVTDAITAIQGDYSKYSGTQAGRNNWVRAIFMFKKWMMMQIHQRRAGVGLFGKHKPHPNLFTGQKDFVGRHSQAGIGYGATAGAIAGGTLIGIGAAPIVAGAVLGVAASLAFGKGVNSYKTIVDNIKLLGYEMINLALLGPLQPVNYVTGRELIPFVAPRSFTETEKGNVKANAAALLHQLMMYAVTHLLANMVLGDCDDEEEMSLHDKAECRTMIFIFNKTQSLMEEMTTLDTLIGYSDVKNTIVPIRKIVDFVRAVEMTYNNYVKNDVYYQQGDKIGQKKMHVAWKRFFSVSMVSDLFLGLDRASREMWMSPVMKEFYLSDDYDVAKKAHKSMKAQLKAVITIEPDLTEYKGKKMSFQDREKKEIYEKSTIPSEKLREEAKIELDKGNLTRAEYEIKLVKIDNKEEKRNKTVEDKINSEIERELKIRLRVKGIGMKFPTRTKFYREAISEEFPNKKAVDAISGPDAVVQPKTTGRKTRR